MFKCIPCPWCGKEYRRLNVEEVYHVYTTTKTPKYAVTCGKCGAVGPVSDTMQDAVSLWNNRSDK